MISIVGAGVAGLCVATELTQRGMVCKVYEKQNQPGPASCSWWAGGMLAPYCEAESAEDCVVRLGKDASQWWQQHTNEVQQNGTLVVAANRDQAELKRFASQTTAFATVNSSDIAELEPDLANRFLKGLYFADEAHLSPRNALASLKLSLINNGVEFVIDEADPNTLAQQGVVIDCRGLTAKPTLQGLRGVKGEMLILRCADIQLKRSIRLLHPRIPLYIVPRGNGIYMLGATMVESSAKAHPTARAIMELLNAAYTIHPAFAEAEILEIGVDSRPAFEDNLPKIKRTGKVIYANGLYRHGFLLAPALARMVADHIQFDSHPEWLECIQ